MVAAPGAAGHGEHEDALGPVHERGGLGEVGGGGPGAQRQALAACVGQAEHPAGAPGDLGDGLVSEAVDDLVEGRLHRRHGGELLDQGVARGDGLPAEHRVAVGVMDGPAHQVAVIVGERLAQLHREGVGQIVEDVLAGREVDGEVVPFGGGDVGDAALHQGLAGGDQLDDAGAPLFEVGVDGAEERRALHGGEEVSEEALLGGLEGRDRGGLGVAVEGLLAVDDAGGLEGILDVGVDDLEGVGVGVVDAPLLRGERMFEDVDLDALVGEGAGLVEAEGLEVAGDHFHRGDAAGLHGGDEPGAVLERGLPGAPEAEALGVGEAGDGGGAGGGDVEDAGAGEGVLEAQSGASLLRGRDLAARAGGAGGVGHGVGFVEYDRPVEGVSAVLVEAAGEPVDDLFETRPPALAGGASERGVGGEQDALGTRDVRALTELAERDDVVVAPAERGPVAAGVFEELVGLAEPERPWASAHPVVEEDAGDLAPLAGAGAVAEHPAGAEADRGRELLAVGGLGRPVAGPFGGGVRVVPLAVVAFVDTQDGLPSLADAVAGGEAAVVGLAGEDDGFELGVGQQPLRDDAGGQHRPVGRRGMGHGGHGGGLHQGGRVRVRVPDARGPRPPGLVGAGGGRGGVRTGLARNGFVVEFDDRPPVARGRGLRLGGAALARDGARGRGGALEQVAGRRGFEGKPRRDAGDDGFEQRGGAGNASGRIEWDICSAPRVAVEDGEAGVEGRAAPRVGAPVDGDGEHHAGGRIEAPESVRPGGVAGKAVARGDRGQPAARGQHGDGRAEVAQVGPGAPPVHAGGGRERRVHQHDGGAEAGQEVGDGPGVVAGDRRAREQAFQEPGADGGDLVQVQAAFGPGPQGALRHHGEHAGPGGGFEHGIAGADGGGLEGGVGERQRGGELLQRDLLFGTPGLGGFEGGQGLDHRDHGLGRAGLAAHGAAPAAEEQRHGGLGRLVGVLPHPGAGGVARPEGARHGVAQGRGVEDAAGLQMGQQVRGGGEQGGRLRAGTRRGRAVRGRNVDGGRARGRGRRRFGVEHGRSPSGIAGRSGGMARVLAPAPPGLPGLRRPASGRRAANGWRVTGRRSRPGPRTGRGRPRSARRSRRCRSRPGPGRRAGWSSAGRRGRRGRRRPRP